MKPEAGYLWSELTAAEIAALAALDALVIVPVASMEQHGPHLPTSTDTVLAQEVSLRAARLIGASQPVVVTPCLWTGLSEHHMSLGGTITLDFATFHAVIRGVLSSLARGGFKRVFLLNSHGGNVAALRTITDASTFELGLEVGCGTYWQMARDELAPLLETQRSIRHACEAETSMMMAIVPDLVRTDRLKEADCPDPRDSVTVGEEPYRWRSFAQKTHSGALGTPSAATREKGERLLEIAAQGVARALLDKAFWR